MEVVNMGRVLLSLLKKQDMKPAELAEKIDKPVTSIYRWCDSEWIGSRSIHLMAEVLKVNPEVFFSGDLDSKKRLKPREELEILRNLSTLKEQLEKGEELKVTWAEVGTFSIIVEALISAIEKVRKP